jgi:predicted nucleotide-binding protein
MNIKPNLKPLYANLKRLKIGEYLNTKEFELFAIENNFDDVWKSCKADVNSKQRVVIMGFHDTEDEEEAFINLLSLWYDQSYDSFDQFILSVLIQFANWYQTKLDFTAIYQNLKQLGLDDNNLLEFYKEIMRIRESKPEVIEEKIIESKKTHKIKNYSKNVFIVHGHDDKARLELSKILKEDLNLVPVVLQEEPNISIETIISKFERLAKDCSAAIILFTPDDDANGKLRARQNVILELGYFLGKFSDEDSRRIVIIKTGDIEIPTDISGVIYFEFFKNMKEIFYDLKKQFESWGFK